MTNEFECYRFGEFLLDTADRQLWRGVERIHLNSRYLDTLVLLVQERGQLVLKERFFGEVWGDVVVGDSALTQCIKEIRKQLGDDASKPRYIQTAPRYGYRFIAPVQTVSSFESETVTPEHRRTTIQSGPDSGVSPAIKMKSRYLLRAVRFGIAGTLGGGVAGIFGGLLYGSALGYAPADPDLGSASIFLVVLTINVVVGLVGGFGVSFGMAGASVLGRRHPTWSITGAALGGLLIGGMIRLLGLDAFTLFFGPAPPGITGGLEGAALGTALALGVRLNHGMRFGSSQNTTPPWRPVVGGSIACALTGALIPVAGGRLLGGSLDLIARSFEGSRLHFEPLGQFVGEIHFGITSQVIFGGIEGLFFGACVVGAIVFSQSFGTSGPAVGKVGHDR